MKAHSVEEIAKAMNMTEQEVEETLDSAILKILQVLQASPLSEEEKVAALLDVLSEQKYYGNTKRKREVRRVQQTQTDTKPSN